ncbi:hypothetical protein FACS1894164_17250 [Spirochaetia bacterium]|nr:hypothetical protein FACS1894164_17250 [Spirochaetia bacterium]
MRKILVLGILIAGTLSAQTQNGTTLYVALKSAAVKSGTGIIASTVATLALGDSVTLLQDKGKWMEVRTAANRTGWITSVSLTSKRVVNSTRTATAEDLALAGKGFSSDIETQYGKDSKVNFTLIDQLEKQNISNTDVYNFIVEGQLRGER